MLLLRGAPLSVEMIHMCPLQLQAFDTLNYANLKHSRSAAEVHIECMSNKQNTSKQTMPAARMTARSTVNVYVSRVDKQPDIMLDTLHLEQ